MKLSLFCYSPRQPYRCPVAEWLLVTLSEVLDCMYMFMFL